MSETQHDRTAGPGAPSGDWWNRRPYRSTNDRKIAGVAGGLGRAFGVDPVLIRVGFVIATIFGGFGLLLYVLGWLLLPADGDQVSAAESLLGRGRSSTPPALAVGLSIVAVIAMFSMFSWGLPFWPLVIIGIVAIVVARKRAAQGGCAGHRNQQQMDEWATADESEGRVLGRGGRAVDRQAAVVGHRGERAQVVDGGLPLREAGVLGRRRRRTEGQPEQGLRHPGGTDAAGLGSAGRRALRLGSARTRARSARTAGTSAAQHGRPGDDGRRCCWSAAWPPRGSSPDGGS